MSNWPKQSPEHIAKRAKAVEGEKNGRYKTGRRSYRDKLKRKGKIKPGSSAIVHHKNGNQDDNEESNLVAISHKKHEEIHRRAAKDSLVYIESFDYWVS